MAYLRDSDYDERDSGSNYPRVISHNEAQSERRKVAGVAWRPGGYGAAGHRGWGSGRQTQGG